MNIPYAILSALIASEVIAVGSAQYLKNVDSWWNDSCQVWSGGGGGGVRNVRKQTILSRHDTSICFSSVYCTAVSIT